MKEKTRFNKYILNLATRKIDDFFFFNFIKRHHNEDESVLNY